jgi:hypothetical protein
MTTKTPNSTAPVLEPLAVGGSVDRLAAIVEGARQGHYALPEASVLAVSAYNRLHKLAEEARGRLRRDFQGDWESGVARAAATTLVQALAAGNEPDDAVADLIAKEDEARLVLAARRVYDAAAEQSTDLVKRMLSEAFVVPALATALEEVLAEVRLLPSDTPTSAEAAIQAGEAEQASYKRLLALSTRHDAIRTAQASCRGDSARDRWVDGMFFDSTTAPQRTGEQVLGTKTSKSGPTEPLARLVWLSGEGNGWVPTKQAEAEAFRAWQGDAGRREPHFSGPFRA